MHVFAWPYSSYIIFSLVMNVFLPPNGVRAEKIIICSFFCIIHVERLGTSLFTVKGS